VNQFIEECRREWRRLRVPRSVENEMAAELEADLAEAGAEGVTPDELAGSDARSFARSWAAERRVARRQPRRMLLFAGLALFVALSLAGAALVLFASPDQSVRAEGQRVLLTPPSSPRNAETVTAVWIAAPPTVQPADDDTRTLGGVLLLVGLGGTTALTLFSLWRRSAAL
jgi:hypothetical protein